MSADGSGNWGRRVRLQLHLPGTLPRGMSVTSLQDEAGREGRGPMVGGWRVFKGGGGGGGRGRVL